ncbi:MAG: hypothetical protein GY810_27510 [Aureispira sp.]|nr:hypothetical protein [Aureispira sp.]
MENIEDLPEEVFDLLSAKKYEEFSTADLELLGEYLSKEDIKSYSVLVQDFLSLDSLVEQELKDAPLAFREEANPKNATITRSIMTRQIPLYQAVAAVVIVLVITVGAFSMFGNQGEPIATQDDNNGGGQFIKNSNPKLLSTDSTLLDKSGKGKSLLEEDYPEELVFTL